MQTNSSKFRRLVFTVVILLAGFAAGLACLLVPKPHDGKDPIQFSAKTAAAWIREISKEPHTVLDTDAHERVLQYLIGELQTLGVQTSIREYLINNDQFGLKSFRLFNLHGKLEGKSDQAILLVTHYDSGFSWDLSHRMLKEGVSYGAADAGYGIATILETIRAIKAERKQLENDIQILITDGEELGMVGAEQEVKQNIGAFLNVKLVINLEARGIKGPAIMFETGIHQSAVIDYYIKYARMPFAYSLATDVYRIMPNGTDFTWFLQNGFSGYNFAVVDSLDYYHTKEDNFKNISLASLQHYGDQVMPLVKKFVFTPSGELPSLVSKTSSVFFNISPGIIFHYPESGNWILLGLLIGLALFIIIVFHRKNQLRLGKILGMVGINFAGMIVFPLFGTLVAYLAALIVKKPYMIVYLPNIPYADLILVGSILIGAFSLTIATMKLLRKNPQGMEGILGGVMVNIILLLACSIYLPGGAFLFLIPALFALIYGLLVAFSKSGFAQTISFAVAVLMILLLYIPLTYMFYLALTFGAAGIIMLFVSMALSLLVPLCKHYLQGFVSTSGDY